MARQCLLFILTRRDVGVHDVETADFRDILGIARIIQKEPPRSEPSSSGLDILQSPSIPLPPQGLSNWLSASNIQEPLDGVPTEPELRPL